MFTHDSQLKKSSVDPLLLIAVGLKEFVDFIFCCCIYSNILDVMIKADKDFFWFSYFESDWILKSSIIDMYNWSSIFSIFFVLRSRTVLAMMVI